MVWETSARILIPFHSLISCVVRAALLDGLLAVDVGEIPVAWAIYKRILTSFQAISLIWVFLIVVPRFVVAVGATPKVWIGEDLDLLKFFERTRTCFPAIF